MRGKGPGVAADYHAALDRLGLELQWRADQVDNASATDMQARVWIWLTSEKDWGREAEEGSDGMVFAPI